jgi:hypothetical protein
MAILAGHRELCRGMVGRGGFKVIGIMATVTGGGDRNGESTRSVAFETRDLGMRSGQRIPRGVVIECGKSHSLRMTTCAVGANTGGAVIGIFRCVIIPDMTGDTGNIESPPRSLLCVFMAAGAVERAVKSTEREAGLLMEAIVVAHNCEGYGLMAP